MQFTQGQIVKSIHTGTLVAVTGPGSHPGTFAGRVTGKPARLCYSWHEWRADSFQPV